MFFFLTFCVQENNDLLDRENIELMPIPPTSPGNSNAGAILVSPENDDDGDDDEDEDEDENEDENGDEDYDDPHHDLHHDIHHDPHHDHFCDPDDCDDCGDCDDCDGSICGSTCGQKVETHNNLQPQRFTEFAKKLQNG